MVHLHNVTFYVGAEEFDRVRDFYADLGIPVVFEEPGHLCCFSVGDELAICVHEAEPGHPAGTRELFLWADVGTDEMRVTDPLGNHVRLHRRQHRRDVG